MKGKKMLNVRKVLTLILICSIMLLCFGCATNQLAVKTTAVQKTQLNLPDPEPITIDALEWFVITPENSGTVWDEVQKNYDSVLFGLTDDGYKNLSLNFAKLRKYIIEQREIINAYKSYYEPKENEK